MQNSVALSTVVAFPMQPKPRTAKREPTPQSPVVSTETIREIPNVQMRVPGKHKGAGSLVKLPSFRRGELLVEFVRENGAKTPFFKGLLYTGKAELQLRTREDGTTHMVLVFCSVCVPEPVTTLCVVTAKKGDVHSVAGAVISLKLVTPTL